ncbi:hypothetical protein D3C87_1842200 [compost metagenome]
METNKMRNKIPPKPLVHILEIALGLNTSGDSVLADPKRVNSFISSFEKIKI